MIGRREQETNQAQAHTDQSCDETRQKENLRWGGMSAGDERGGADAVMATNESRSNFPANAWAR